MIKRGELENSIVMDDCHIDIEEKITDSLIGPSSTIVKNRSGTKGYRFILGESSRIIV